MAGAESRAHAGCEYRAGLFGQASGFGHGEKGNQATRTPDALNGR